MDEEATSRPDLRELGRNAIRAEIIQRAVVLLDERGFDQTTVEDIAAAVGISPRSFFRYFPTKEDIVLGDLVPLGHVVEKALMDRPADESAWSALRGALAPLVDLADSDPVAVLRSTRVALSTPGLRAKSIERHTLWAALLVPVLSPRLTTKKQKHSEMAAGALAQSALACLYVATIAWVDSDGTASYSELLDEAFDAVARP